MPGVGKKADAVADRSGVPLLYNLACLYQSSPTRRERRHAFPGSQVFGAGTLPVGVQGRSALVAKGEIPVCRAEISILSEFGQGCCNPFPPCYLICGQI